MKKMLNCVIVDDEPLAQDLIEKFINRVSYLALLAKFDNAIDAMDGITILKPDIIFLDINMPEMSGIEFLDSFSGVRPHIIMTTAYPEYALEGFEHDAIDYILKPIAFSRFMKAIHKVLDRLLIKAGPNKELEPVAEAQVPEPVVSKPIAEKDSGSKERFFMVKEDKKLVKVNVADIVFVEGMKDYIKIHLPNRFLVIHMTMTKIVELLPPPQFIRINRSFIIQVSFIKLIEGNMVETSGGNKLPIGINYRESVREAMQAWTI